MFEKKTAIGRNGYFQKSLESHNPKPWQYKKTINSIPALLHISWLKFHFMEFEGRYETKFVTIDDTDMQFYSASFLGDMCEVVAHIGARYPKANLYAAGWSLGANILVRYLGQVSTSCNHYLPKQFIHSFFFFFYLICTHFSQNMLW